MRLADKSKLTLRYGRDFLIAGAVYNLWFSIQSLMLDSFVPIGYSLLLKLLVMSALFALDKKRRAKDTTVYYYINLGLSTRSMSAIILIIDYLSFVVLLLGAYLLWLPTHS